MVATDLVGQRVTRADPWTGERQYGVVRAVYLKPSERPKERRPALVLLVAVDRVGGTVPSTVTLVEIEATEAEILPPGGATTDTLPHKPLTPTPPARPPVRPKLT
jgi:hypothetical protein